MIDIVVKSEKLAQSLHKSPQWHAFLRSLTSAEVGVALWIDGQERPYRYWIKQPSMQESEPVDKLEMATATPHQTPQTAS